MLLSVPKGSEKNYQLWVSSGKKEASYPLIGKCKGKPKMGLIGFKTLILKSQSNGHLALSLNTSKSENLI